VFATLCLWAITSKATNNKLSFAVCKTGVLQNTDDANASRFFFLDKVPLVNPESNLNQGARESQDMDDDQSHIAKI